MEKQQPVIKKCADCGKEFECLHSTACWCMDYEISPENLKKLQQTYNDCLCPACLERYSQGRKKKADKNAC